VSRRLKQQEVGVYALVYPHTSAALVARFDVIHSLRVADGFAIERFGELDCNECLADIRRACEKVRMRHAARKRGPLQHLQRPLMTGNVAKAHGILTFSTLRIISSWTASTL